MLDPIPKMAKNVDPELFARFEKDLPFMLKGKKRKDIGYLIALDESSFSRYLTGDYPVTTDIIDKLYDVFKYALEKRDKQQSEYEEPPEPEKKEIEEKLKEDYGESDINEKFETITNELLAISATLKRIEDASLSSRRKIKTEASSGEGLNPGTPTEGGGKTGKS